MANLKHSPNQHLFARASGGIFRVLILAAASVALMMVDSHYGHLHGLRRALSTLVYPVQALVDVPYAVGDWAGETLATRTRLLKENTRLKHESLVLKARLQRMDSLERENDRLRALMDSSARVHGKVLVAELLAVDLDPFRQEITLDKGLREGVYDGQPLLDADGIMGQVTHAGPFTAQAILITDPNHALPVEVNRNGLRTIAVGTGDIDRLDLPYLPNNADIRQGDLLVTSGLGGRFPRGYPVGTVTQVRHRPGEAFADISARPSAALSRSHEVLLLWPPDSKHEPAKDTHIKGGGR